MILGDALTNLDAWVTGVLFPLAVVLSAGLLAYVARCAVSILSEFRKLRQDVARMTHALVKAGILEPE